MTRKTDPVDDWWTDPALTGQRVEIATFVRDDDPQYGHVEVVTSKQARHYRRQTWRQIVRSFLARLADSVRGRK